MDCSIRHRRGGAFYAKSILDVQLCRELQYCVTATLSSATVPSGQYAKYNGSSSQAICSVNANLATKNGDGWTTIVGKQKKNGSKTLDQEMEHKRTNG